MPLDESPEKGEKRGTPTFTTPRLPVINMFSRFPVAPGFRSAVVKRVRSRLSVLLPTTAVWGLCWAIALLPGLPGAAEETAAVERRLADSARYLASDELEGRGVGTKGLDLAAEYIAAQFVQAGLKTELFDGTPFQTFVMPTRRSPGAMVYYAMRAGLGIDSDALKRRIEQKRSLLSLLFSKLIDDDRIVGQNESEAKNVVAVLEGEGPLSDEVLVIGAHYDHLGWGGYGSRESTKKKEIHNGADDNASGVAVLMEVARDLAGRQEKLRRSVVFIAFSGEESGMIGSGHYVDEPVFPIDKTVAMLNLDMVGRLRDDKLIIGGSGTAASFDKLLDQLNGRHGFQLTKNPSGYGPSDHLTFYTKKVPVLFFFTGMHKQLHRPDDDFDYLDISGMRRIGAMVADVVVTLANADERPQYVSVGRKRARKGGDRPYFGSIPDFSKQGPGFAISGVSEGGPAQRAGLLEGDVIVRFGESKIDNLEDFDSALRKHKGGERVRVIVRRDEEKLTLEVTLEPPR